MIRSSENSRKIRRVSVQFRVRVGVRVSVAVGYGQGLGWVYARALIPPSEVLPCARKLPDPWKIHPKSLSRGLTAASLQEVSDRSAPSVLSP